MPVSDNFVNQDLFTRRYFTVATLPAAGTAQGAIQWVTDLSDNPAVATGKVAVGSGTTQGRVISDGTSWRVYGWSV